jgi:two-component system KDP operon response regulator KdpE
MNKNTVLVVEDDKAVRNMIALTLETHNYHHIEAVSGTEAISLSLSYKPDLMILDLGLPDIDGVEVIRKTRTWSMVPIIVVSARTDDADKISALDEGANDYLTKPFSVDAIYCVWFLRRRTSGRDVGCSSIWLSEVSSAKT